MSNGKILFVIAHEGFQPTEYTVSKKIITDAGFTVITASDVLGTAHSKDALLTVPIDLAIHHVSIKEYDGIFFIGGPGALEHLDTPESHTLLKKAQAGSLPIGAICIATRILAHAGILTGRQATGWNGDDALESIYQQCGVQYRKNQSVVVDENIITASGPEAATEFAEQIIVVMQGNKGWG